MTAKFAFAAHSRHAILPVLLGSLLLSSIGCGVSSTPNLTITSINQNQCWQQGFTQAWMSRNGSNGDVDVVLVDQATEQVMNGSAVSCPVRQVMHIRVLWSPTKDMRAVISNASVTWYVISQSKQQDHLEYSGIAFVSMEEDEKIATLKIRNAVLTPSGNHGQLTDPVGASRLEGTFVAREDSATVGKVLNGVKTALAASADNAHSRMAGVVGTVESK